VYGTTPFLIVGINFGSGLTYPRELNLKFESVANFLAAIFPLEIGGSDKAVCRFGGAGLNFMGESGSGCKSVILFDAEALSLPLFKTPILFF
jgi:hypothetical protein